jgi:hypothetical protein
LVGGQGGWVRISRAPLLAQHFYRARAPPALPASPRQSAAFNWHARLTCSGRGAAGLMCTRVRARLCVPALPFSSGAGRFDRKLALGRWPPALHVPCGCLAFLALHSSPCEQAPVETVGHGSRRHPVMLGIDQPVRRTATSGESPGCQIGWMRGCGVNVGPVRFLLSKL